MNPLTVKILGSGNAAKSHRRAYETMPLLYKVKDSSFVDIVDICTPPHMHTEQVIGAMLSGSHVIVEKPICGSLCDIDRIIRLSESTEMKVCPVFQYRFANHDPVTPDMESHWKRDNSYYSGWRGLWSKSYGGAMTSHGLHLIDLSIQQYGMPEEVSGGAVFGIGVEQVATALLKRGKIGDISFITINIDNNKSDDGFNLGNSHHGYVKQFSRLHTALTKDTALPVTLRQARQSLEVLTAFYYSILTEKTVQLPISRDHEFYQEWQQPLERLSQRSQAFQKIS